jgi:outer membrane protein assembly factor BamB
MRSRVIPGLGACLLTWLLVAGSRVGAEGADDQLLRNNRLPTDGPGLVEFFRQRAAGAGDVDRLKALIRQLGDDDFYVREDAARRLVSLGGRCKLSLRDAVNDPDVEVRVRARECLRQIDHGEGSAVMVAAVRVLARQHPEGAAAALLDYLPAAEDEAVAEQIRDALAQLAAGEPKTTTATSSPTTSVLEAALKDPSAVKRASAAVALLRANPHRQQQAARRLLTDPDVAVRAQVALALAVGGDRDAVPALIDLLAAPPAPETRLVPEVLYRLAGDKAPPAPAESAPADVLRKYREDWKTWWKNEGEKVDAARLGEVVKTAGHTLVLLLDDGKAIYLDAANRPLWELDKLQFPLDAQMLSGDRILLAEHQGNRVTERNRQNQVLWEKKVEGPIAAQRLPNGNTFIATRQHLLEIDAKGAEVFRHERPNGEMIMKAQKLPNGDYACVTQLGATRYVRLNAQGREVKSFVVTLNYSGGRIHVLPNGNVVVPESNNNRVVEHDGNTGRIVWQAAFDQPVAALRLPTGHTLVTSMNPARGAAELDRAGRDVWQFKADTRVTRAFRHE